MKGNERRLKDVELEVLGELMKNSRRSDREIAKVLGISQPTVSRTISRLNKEGYIKEYTVIPDFKKLGYEIMAITLARRSEGVNKEKWNETRKGVQKLEKENPYAAFMAVNVNGKFDVVFIGVYEDYRAYSKAMELTRKLPNIEIETIESYLVNVADETNYRLLSLSEVADRLIKVGKIA